MVTTQGFNALLKLVEEPPPHLRFIFATTEPDKVLPTIRSRTHHYPFRLIPPRLLSSYLSELCEKEGVTIEPAALPLVVRAGAGSARDTLSVLDQLLGGAGPAGVTHAARHRAARLHARHPARRGGRRVRRRRRRGGLRGRRQGDRDRAGPAPLHRGPAAPAARPGHRRRRARTPRPPASSTLRGPGRAAGRAGRPVRLRRAQPRRRPGGHRPHRDARRHRARGCCSSWSAPGCCCPVPTTPPTACSPASTGSRSGSPSPARRPPQAAAPRRAVPPAQDRPRLRPHRPRPSRRWRSTRSSARCRRPRTPRRPRPGAGGAAPATAPPARGRPRPSRPRRAARRARAPRPPSRHPSRPVARAAEPPPARPAAGAAAPAGGLTLVDVRRLWPDIVDATKLRRRVTWMHLTQNCQVVGDRGRGADAGLLQRRRPRLLRQRRQRRDRAPGRDRRRRRRLADRDDRRPRRQGRPARATRGDPAAPAAPPEQPAPPHRPPRHPPSAGGADEPPSWAADEPAPAGRPAEDADAPPRRHRSAPGPARSRPPGPASSRPDRPATTGPVGNPRYDADADAHPDDLDADNQGLDSAELLRRELGARVIDEIPNA